MEELRRKVRERLARAEKVRRRGEEGERVRRRRRGEGGASQLAILGDLVERREEPDGGGRVNLGLRVDEMELREEIVRREKRMEDSGGKADRERVRQASVRVRQCAPIQLENLSISGEEVQVQVRGRSCRRGSTARSSPTQQQLATIHEPDDEVVGREGDPEVVIRVTDLCEQ